jgi:trehalose-6-phosphate synthase
VGLDPHVIRAVASSGAVDRRRRALGARLAAEGDPRLIVRVDRLDPTKNALRGFLAFEALLEERPALARRLRFLAVMGASRTGLAAYDAYAAEVIATVERINARWRAEIGRDVVWLDRDGGYERAIAALRIADVVLVNPIADGMNLVAKEAVVVNERDAALVLSRRAGAARQLGPFALTIDATDVDATTAALTRALDMPAEERRARIEAMRALVEASDTRRWLADNLEDLRETVAVAPRSAEAMFRAERRGRIANRGRSVKSTHGRPGSPRRTTRSGIAIARRPAFAGREGSVGRLLRARALESDGLRGRRLPRALTGDPVGAVPARRTPERETEVGTRDARE